MQRLITEEHRTTYRVQGYVLLPRHASAILIHECRNYVAAAPPGTKGDQSNHAWWESDSALPSKIVRQIPLRVLSDVICESITNHVAWINVFSSGEFISAHRDASGDAQMLICVDAPLPELGGQLWVGNVTNTVVMTSRDIVIFQASKLEHGTTPIIAEDGECRVTLNVRVWATAASIKSRLVPP